MNFNSGFTKVIIFPNYILECTKYPCILSSYTYFIIKLSNLLKFNLVIIIQII